MNTKRFYWLAQLLGWTAYCALVGMSVYNRDASLINSVFIVNLFIVIVSGVIVTHIQRLVFIRLGWLDMKLPQLLPRLLLSSVLSAFTIAFIDITTDRITNLNGVGSQPFSSLDALVGVLAVLLLVLFWNAIYFTFHFFQQSRNQEISNLQLKASNRESELKNLRSQLNPHFLFNSLNSIKALVDMNPAKAKQSVTTLSNLLRQSLVLGKENLVSLESELDLAKNYLELEKIRFEERLKVEWELTPGLEGFEIPPFSLQMMVENAIKHGISNLKDGGVVRVEAFEEDEFVVIRVINSGNLSSVSDLGVGIQNIRKRLMLQYDNEAEFMIEDKDGFVIATMKFKR